MALSLAPGPVDPALAEGPSAPAPSTSTATEPALDLQRFALGVARRWWLLALLGAIGVAIAFVRTHRQAPLYRATTSVIIESNTPRVLSGVEDVMPGGTVAGFLQTEHEVLRSRQIRLAAAQQLQADGVLAPSAEPADALLLGKYTVEPEKSAALVRVVAVDEDGARAAAIANAVADAYEAQNLQRKRGGTRQAETWLTAQHADLRKQLEDSEDALLHFLQDNDVLNASIESQLTEVLQRITAFNSRLADEEATRIKDSLDVEVLLTVQKDPTLIDTLPEIQSASVVTSLKSRLVEMRALRTELSARYQDEHPKLKVLNEQIATVEADLKREVGNVLTALERRRDSVETSIAGLRKALDHERTREARLNRLTLEYARLKRDVDTNVRLYELVTSRMKEAEVSVALPFNNVRVLDRAQAPRAPFSPNVPVALVAGLLLGVLLGLAIAVGIEALDNTVKSQEELEALLQIPFLGLLPVIEGPVPATDPRLAREHLRKRDMFIFREPKSAAAECARFIRTNLLFMSPDRPLRTLAVTSAAPQEGKTTTAVSIAIAMAQAGSRTLIVDTDLRRPRLHKTFAIDQEGGLSSMILGEHTAEQVIVKSEVANLDVLVCGPLPPNPAELLHTARFKEIVADLARRYDHVIFDTAPVGPVTDPVVLGAQVDGVVLVAKCDQTTRAMARAALRTLQDANVRLLGAILNDVDVTSKRYAGVYYSYYRRYTYGAEEPATKAAE